MNILRSPGPYLVVMLFLFGGCAGRMAVLPGGSAAVLDRLYFGRAMPNGGEVSDDGWRTFLRESITPRFPNGLTYWAADGQWRDSTGLIVRERSFVLELLHDGVPARDSAIGIIIADYRSRFQQEAVLWMRGAVTVRFD